MLLMMLVAVVVVAVVVVAVVVVCIIVRTIHAPNSASVQVIYETLRLFPTVPSFPRTAAIGGWVPWVPCSNLCYAAASSLNLNQLPIAVVDTTVGGFDVPRGSVVAISQVVCESQCKCALIYVSVTVPFSQCACVPVYYYYCV